MPILETRIVNPGGVRPYYARLEIRPVIPAGPPGTVSFGSAQTISGVLRVEPDSDGYVSVEVPALAELGAYHVARIRADRDLSEPVPFVMPATGGPYQLRDLHDLFTGIAPPLAAFDFSTLPSMSSSFMTRDASDDFAVALNGGKLRFTANAGNVDTNTRKVYSFDELPELLGSEVRSKWAGQSTAMLQPAFQQGHAHRITRAGGVTKCLAVTKGVAFSANWFLNVHTWDSSLGTPYTQIGGFDLSAYLYPGSVVEQLPWWVKSRVRGNLFEVAVWLDGDPEPPYGAPGQSGGCTIPAPFDEQIGDTGLMVNHLAANAWMEFDSLTVSYA